MSTRRNICVTARPDPKTWIETLGQRFVHVPNAVTRTGLRRHERGWAATGISSDKLFR